MGAESGDAALTSQKTDKELGEAGDAPHVSFLRRIKVDALASLLLLVGIVFLAQGVQIVRRDGFVTGVCCRLLMSSLFPLVPQHRCRRCPPSCRADRSRRVR